MRIIAGKYKSRRIFLPKQSSNSSKGHDLRPTSDRARETLFDVLNNYIEFDNIRCLDLFAGTGALGFEALSRGAGFCCFVDISKGSLNLIERTGTELQCSEQIELVRDKAVSYLEKVKSEYFDMIFADPPYSYEKYDLLAETALMLKPQIFVLELSSGMQFEFKHGNYQVIEKKSGSAKFLLFVQK